MAERNVGTLTTSERLALLINAYYAKKSAVVNSLSATANKGIEIGGTSTAPTVGIKLSAKTGNVLSFATGENEDGGLFLNVSVAEKGSPNTGYLKSYQILVNGTPVGLDIDIPKDFLVKSATSGVVTAEDKAAGGKFENNESYAVGDAYLDFVINVKSGTATDEHVYDNVKDLVDVYTAGHGLQESNNVFSVKLDPTSVNGLTVSANGLKLAAATADTYGGVAASGTYVAGTKYYTTAACTVEVDTSSFVAGETDVSGYFVFQKTADGVTGAMTGEDKYKLNHALTEDDITDYTEAELRTLLGLPAAE